MWVRVGVDGGGGVVVCGCEWVWTGVGVKRKRRGEAGVEGRTLDDRVHVPYLSHPVAGGQSRPTDPKKHLEVPEGSTFGPPAGTRGVRYRSAT